MATGLYVKGFNWNTGTVWSLAKIQHHSAAAVSIGYN